MASKQRESWLEFFEDEEERRPDHIEVVTSPPPGAQPATTPLLPTPAPAPTGAPIELAPPAPPVSAPLAPTAPVVRAPAGAAALGQSHRGMRRSRALPNLSDTEGEEDEVEVSRREHREARRILDMNSMGQMMRKIMGSLVAMADVMDNERVDSKLPGLGDMAALTQKIRSGPPSVANGASEREDHLEAFARRNYLHPRRTDHIVNPPSEETFTDAARARNKRDRGSHAIKQHFGRQKVFSGSGSDREPNIVELLCDATEAQEQLCLSKKEFITELSKKFTLSAWSLFRSVKSDCEGDVGKLYEDLLDQWDTRPKPQQALEELSALKSDNYSSMTGVLQDIHILASRACLIETNPDTQALVKEHYCKLNFLRLLPTSVRWQVQHNLESLEASLPEGKASFQDLVQIARRYKTQIDRTLGNQYKSRQAKESKAAIRTLEAPRPSDAPAGPSTGARPKTYPRKDNQGTSQNNKKERTKKENLVDFDPKQGEEPKYESRSGIKKCFKCNATGHGHRDCPIQGDLASAVCHLCPLEGRHQPKFCPFALAAKYQKAVLGPAAATNPKQGEN